MRAKLSLFALVIIVVSVGLCNLAHATVPEPVPGESCAMQLTDQEAKPILAAYLSVLRGQARVSYRRGRFTLMAAKHYGWSTIYGFADHQTGEEVFFQTRIDAELPASLYGSRGGQSVWRYTAAEINQLLHRLNVLATERPSIAPPQPTPEGPQSMTTPVPPVLFDPMVRCDISLETCRVESPAIAIVGGSGCAAQTDSATGSQAVVADSRRLPPGILLWVLADYVRDYLAEQERPFWGREAVQRFERTMQKERFRSPR